MSQQQAEFEAWMASSNYPEIAEIALEKLPDGNYKSQNTFAAWQGWQGALNNSHARLEAENKALREIADKVRIYADARTAFPGDNFDKNIEEAGWQLAEAYRQFRARQASFHRGEIGMDKLFAPRWKRYAPWPLVIWHRLFGHGEQRSGFYTGQDRRCDGCGDKIFVRDRFTPEQNVGYRNPYK